MNTYRPHFLIVETKLGIRIVWVTKQWLAYCSFVWNVMSKSSIIVSVNNWCLTYLDWYHLWFVSFLICFSHNELQCVETKFKYLLLLKLFCYVVCPHLNFHSIFVVSPMTIDPTHTRLSDFLIKFKVVNKIFDSTYLFLFSCSIIFWHKY